MKNGLTQKQFKSIYRWMREVVNKCLTAPVTTSLTRGYDPETKVRYLSLFVHCGDELEYFGWTYDEPEESIVRKKQCIIGFLDTHGVNININL